MERQPVCVGPFLVGLAVAVVIGACTTSTPLAGGGGASAGSDNDGGPGGPGGNPAGGGPGVEGSKTLCVDGAAVSIGSTMESGGIAPEIPETTTRATKPVPPLSGGTLLALSDDVTAAISDPDRDQVYLVDTRAGAVRATVVLPDGDEPGRLAEDAAGRVHVVLRRGGAIVSIDAASGTVIARRTV